jgi:uncharacterized protein (TIGR03437 family)
MVQATDGNLYGTAIGGINRDGTVFRLALGLASTTPSVPASGVTDGAGFSGRIAGGGIGSVFGTNLAEATTAASSLPLPTTLGDVTLKMNEISAPLFLVSPGQINFQVPWELLSSPTATLTVTTPSGTSSSITVSLSSAAPGIFTIKTANSPTQGVIKIANTSTFVARREPSPVPTPDPPRPATS